MTVASRNEVGTKNYKNYNKTRISHLLVSSVFKLDVEKSKTMLPI